MSKDRQRPSDDDGIINRRLYRNKERGMISGVCAGLADYFGFDLALTRILTVCSCIFFAPATLLIYFGSCFLIPKRPVEPVRPVEEEKFQRAVRSSPQATLSNVRHRFREMEMRLQRMERYVTSPRFQLDREFRDLED